MKSLKIFFITLVLTSQNEASESSCNSLMKYNEKIFTFQSPNYPSSIGNGSLMCNLRIEHAPSIEDVQMQLQQECQDGGGGGGDSGGNGGGDEDGQDDGSGGHEAICQVRLDFDEFLLQPPLLGNCQYDKMWVTANGKYPLLCGQNTKQHIYLDVAGKQYTDVTFLIDELQEELYQCPNRLGLAEKEPNAVYTVIQENQRLEKLMVNVQANEDLQILQFDTRRAWNIQVTQIPCGCPKSESSSMDRLFSNNVPKAPVGCLSYHTGITGDLKSFNYDSFCCYSHDYLCNGNALNECDMSAGYTGHLNNLDYSICIAEEYGFCGIEYIALEDEIGSFSLTNKTEMTPNSSFDEMRMDSGASNGDESCGTDYLVLPGGHCKDDQSHYSSDRFCGNNLGVAGMSQSIVQFSSPFILQVVTDKDELTGSVDYMNRGFHLRYNQIPCR